MKTIILIFSCSVVFVDLDSKNIKEQITESLMDTQNETIDLLLQEMMIKTLHQYSCVAIITDPIYSVIFEKSWFKRFNGYISFFMIIVSESEDLLAPTNDTQSSLKTAKNNGCQMYIILLANGLQVSRLLKFGDRYRVLDTRSNYILLFDYRLFENKMLYIWKRIINVVFIRKYSTRKVDDRPNKNDWFELTTVPFPNNFDDTLVPRRLDIWTQKKFRKVANLFKDKTADLKNQTLKVVAFSHAPGTVKGNLTNKGIRAYLKTENNRSFSGSEVEIVDAISKQMNFRCELYEPENPDEELWGRKQVGGIYTGILGEMTTSRADLALGDLYYIPFMLEIMDLSIPYNTECLTFLTPEALTDISWKTLILPFSPIMWTCVILCLFFSSIAFYLLAKFHMYLVKMKKPYQPHDQIEKQRYQDDLKRKFRNMTIYSHINKMDIDVKYSMLKEQYRQPKKKDDPEGLYQFADPQNSILYTYSMLLLVSLPKLPTGWSLRLLTGWYWLYCLLVVVSYRASMTAILSRPPPRVTIDSLQGLIDSKLTYGGWGEINAEFFKSSSDNFIDTIRQNFQSVNNSDDAVDRVAAGSFAFYENTYFLKEGISKRVARFQENSFGNDTNRTQPSNMDRSLHIMKDCIINMPVSIGLQKNSPIKPRVDKSIRRVLEAGLVDKWLNDVMSKIISVATEKSGDGQKALMNLKKMYGALVLLGVGYFLGAAALVVEILYYKFVVKKQPAFIKFTGMVYNVKNFIRSFRKVDVRKSK